MKSFIHVASILAIAPRVSVQLGGYIEYQKQQMGQLYKEFIEPLIPIYDEQVNKYGLQAHIQRHLYGSPVNDVGVTRIIEWKAFGSIWKISFPNTWQYNSLGEEFASVLQILLVELSNSSIDLHFIRTIIEIEIVASDDLKTPEQLPSNDTFKWKFFTQKVDANERSEIRFQMASLIIGMKYLLRDVSMLHDDKFFEIVDKLFQNEALAEKTMSVNLYQRIYRKLFIQEIFDASQRNVFTQELLQIELDEDPLLKWNSSLSHLYSERESLRHIEDRFKNTGIATHLTIDHIKTLPGYEAWLNNLHKKGWLDWQIILAMYNHICNYKANSMVGYKSFSSEELRKAAFDEEFHKIRNKDEQETYVEFPLDYFVGSEFNSQLNHSLWLVLHTWGLENRASFPNFPSIKDFLKNRFNVGIDDIKGLSPFI